MMMRVLTRGCLPHLANPGRSPFHAGAALGFRPVAMAKPAGFNPVAAARPPEAATRHFQTSASRPALPPILIMLIKPLSRIFAVVAGRRFRKWWRAMEPKQKERVKEQSRKYSHLWGFLGFSALAAGAYGYKSHVEEAPITGRRRFVALTQDQMQRISGKEFKELLQVLDNEILPTAHPAYIRVSRVVAKILKGNIDIERVKEKDWTISVINRQEKNAFVLPNGNIFVFAGMLEMCQNDEQLGIILSHEIAHTLLDHGVESLSRANLLSVLLVVPLAVLWALLPSDAIAIFADWLFSTITSIIVELPFNREMESEADAVGLDMAAKACFDVREAPAFWKRMDLLSETKEEDSQPPEFLSTHPSHSRRHHDVALLVPEAIKTRINCNCHPLRGPDPNNAVEKALSDREKKTFTRIVV